MKIQRVQHEISGTDGAMQRIHYVPYLIRVAAASQRDEAIAMVGRDAAPTIADVYYHHILLGAQAVLKAQKAWKAFVKIAKDAAQPVQVHSSCRISFNCDSDALVKKVQKKLKEAGLEVNLTETAVKLIAFSISTSSQPLGKT